MSKNLFGKNIEPNCEYCDRYDKDGDAFICTAKKQIKNGKCRKFQYNPTLRVPKSENNLMDFNKEDFDI